jgi:hypothetical protein
MERQIILDFHFRGEQDVFEAEYPYLIDKARAMIGDSLYDELSGLVGVSLEHN